MVPTPPGLNLAACTGPAPGRNGVFPFLLQFFLNVLIQLRDLKNCGVRLWEVCQDGGFFIVGKATVKMLGSTNLRNRPDQIRTLFYGKDRTSLDLRISFEYFTQFVATSTIKLIASYQLKSHLQRPQIRYGTDSSAPL